MYWLSTESCKLKTYLQRIFKFQIISIREVIFSLNRKSTGGLENWEWKDDDPLGGKEQVENWKSYNQDPDFDDLKILQK